MNLSVNLNKVWLLRNSRGSVNPSPEVAARTVVDGGAKGLTLHWREDNRHTRKEDVYLFSRLAKELGVEFNLEGDAREELLALAREIKPTQFTLVPVTPGEVTSDHGWRLPEDRDLIKRSLEPLKAAGVRTAIFVDPEADSMEHATGVCVDRVEIYTEPYAAAFGTDKQEVELKRFAACAKRATELGLGVNAGHDLNLANMPLVAQRVPELLEVSIGHALLADALYIGLREATARYVRVVAGETVDVPVTC